MIFFAVLTLFQDMRDRRFQFHLVKHLEVHRGNMSHSLRNLLFRRLFVIVDALFSVSDDTVAFLTLSACRLFSAAVFQIVAYQPGI